jgi:hypothetical protein
MRRLATAAVAATALTLSLAGVAGAREPTCSQHFPFPHGYHIIADYVTGIGSEFLGGPGIEWPPKGLNAEGGAVLPGGPGPAFHFVLGVAPGASFCNDSNSPGSHIH